MVKRKTSSEASRVNNIQHQLGPCQVVLAPVLRTELISALLLLATALLHNPLFFVELNSYHLLCSIQKQTGLGCTRLHAFGFACNGASYLDACFCVPYP